MASSRAPASSSLRRASTAYRSSLRRLVSFSRFGSKPGLSRINKLLSALGHPENNLKCVLVAGTNGKGSTTAMLAKILSASDRKTGSYSSPSIFSFCERIQIDGQMISKKDFAIRAQEVFSILPALSGDHPTFFEVMTAMALLHFKRCGVDYAVLEAGLGGRFDATNAVNPELSIITSIGLEHADVLGKTTPAIAREKAGIMRAGKPVVCAVKDKAALDEIKKISKRLHSPFYFANANSAAGIAKKAGLPAFQLSNIAAAAKAAALLGVKPPIINRALSTFSMPARWQRMSSKPSVTIDCCHNPPAAKQIQKDLEHDFAPSQLSPRVLLFSAMKDKDYAQVLSLLAPHFDRIIICRLPYARAAKANDLKTAASAAMRNSAKHIRPKNIAVISNPDSALLKSKSIAGKRGRILVCGSMYLLQFLYGEREFRMTG